MAQGPTGSDESGPIITTSTATLSLLPISSFKAISPSAIKLGSMFRVRAAGRCSNIVTTPGTLAFSLVCKETSYAPLQELFVTDPPVTVFSSGDIPLCTTAKVDVN